jgi:hypothetical protein
MGKEPVKRCVLAGVQSGSISNPRLREPHGDISQCAVDWVARGIERFDSAFGHPCSSPPDVRNDGTKGWVPLRVTAWLVAVAAPVPGTSHLFEALGPRETRTGDRGQGEARSRNPMPNNEEHTGSDENGDDDKNRMPSHLFHSDASEEAVPTLARVGEFFLARL